MRHETAEGAGEHTAVVTTTTADDRPRNAFEDDDWAVETDQIFFERPFIIFLVVLLAVTVVFSILVSTRTLPPHVVSLTLSHSLCRSL
jgi:hypothetical protein